MALQQATTLRAEYAIEARGNTPSLLSTACFAAVVFIVAGIVIYHNLGACPLFNPDEAYYSEPAREMVESGNYITQMLNYAIRWTKPSLSLWPIAACFHLFGVTEFAARFYSATCASLIVVLTGLFARKYNSTAVGTLTAAVLLTSPLFIGIARESIADMPLALFVSTSLMCFFHSYQQKLNSYRWLAWTLIGLGVMIKGPVAVVLPALILFAYHLLRGQLGSALKFFKPIHGALVVLAVAVPWYATVIWQSHGDYFREFILRENLQRFTSVVDHKAPWFYHLLALFGGMAPWSLFLPPAIITAGRRWRDANESDSLALFCLCSVAIIVGFFSLSVSKLLPYTIPAFPFAAVLIAGYLERCAQERKVRTTAIIFGALASVFGAVPFGAPHLVNLVRDFPPNILPVIDTGCGAISAGALIACIAVLVKKMRIGFAAVAATLAGVAMTIGTTAAVTLSQKWEVPIKSYSQFVAGSDWPVLVYQMRKPSVPFYLHRQATFTDVPQLLYLFLNVNPHAYVICKTDLCADLEKVGCKKVNTDGNVSLVQWIAPGGFVSR